MSQPILTVSGPTTTEAKARVSLLPCRIHHDGDVGAISGLWSPAMSKDGSQQNVAYLRGRKLYGKIVKLPEGYYGAVASRQDDAATNGQGQKGRRRPEEEEDAMSLDEQHGGDGEDDQESGVKVGAMRNEGVFDEFIVWGHESVADASADAYVRGIEEWVGFAEKIHAYPIAAKETSSS